jgi:hypothetical protein
MVLGGGVKGLGGGCGTGGVIGNLFALGIKRC